MDRFAMTPALGGFPGYSGYPGAAGLGSLGAAGCACSGSLGSPSMMAPTGGLTGMDFQSSLQQTQMMMQMMLMLLTSLLLGQPAAGLGGGAGSGTGLDALGGPSAAPSSGGGSAAGSSAGAPASGSDSVGPSQSSTPSASPASPASPGQGASPVNIGAGTKVLEIGDSHTVGTFGHELDEKLRSTGAQVATYAAAGASPSWFVNGTPTKYGYWEKHADGSQKNVNYGQSQATPKLEQLIAKEKPNVIVVNLGANFRGSNPKAQVDQIGQIAKKHNIPIVWVGPPKSAKDNADASSLQKFDREMAAAVAPYGTYVASTPFTSKYVGGDGLHYGGSEGNKIARQWADGVFKAITGR